MAKPKAQTFVIRPAKTHHRPAHTIKGIDGFEAFYLKRMLECFEEPTPERAAESFLALRSNYVLGQARLAAIQATLDEVSRADYQS